MFLGRPLGWRKLRRDGGARRAATRAAIRAVACAAGALSRSARRSPPQVSCDALVSINHNDNKKYKTELYRDSLYGLVDKRYAAAEKAKR